jgi:hypothetical protein
MLKSLKKILHLNAWQPFSARTKYSLIEPSSDNLEMADNFGISEEVGTSYTFPMSVPYMAKMQEQDNKFMTEIKNDNHNFELKK